MYLPNLDSPAVSSFNCLWNFNHSLFSIACLLKHLSMIVLYLGQNKSRNTTIVMYSANTLRCCSYNCFLLQRLDVITLQCRLRTTANKTQFPVHSPSATRGTISFRHNCTTPSTIARIKKLKTFFVDVGEGWNYIILPILIKRIFG